MLAQKAMNESCLRPQMTQAEFCQRISIITAVEKFRADVARHQSELATGRVSAPEKIVFRYTQSFLDKRAEAMKLYKLSLGQSDGSATTTQEHLVTERAVPAPERNLCRWRKTLDRRAEAIRMYRLNLGQPDRHGFISREQSTDDQAEAVENADADIFERKSMLAAVEQGEAQMACHDSELAIRRVISAPEKVSRSRATAMRIYSQSLGQTDNSAIITKEQLISDHIEVVANAKALQSTDSVQRRVEHGESDNAASRIVHPARTLPAVQSRTEATQPSSYAHSEYSRLKKIRSLQAWQSIFGVESQAEAQVSG